MKSFFKLTGKLILTFIATSVIAFITMMMCLGANIEFAIKIAVGCLFIVFIYYVAWNGSLISGEEDTKNHIYKPYKGFFSALLAMTPALIIAILYCIVSYRGWDGQNRVLADGFYMILYLTFLSFTPILSLLVPYNPAFTVDFAQPSIAILNNISTPNAVSALLFFVPIILFIVIAGVGYIFGHKERLSLTEVVKKIKNNK